MYGKNELIPVNLEHNIFNFYLNREVTSTETNNVNDADQYPTKKLSAVGKRVWQSGELVSPTTTLNQEAVPIGDDIEPVGESCVDVDTGNKEEEEEESLKVGIPIYEVIKKKLRAEKNGNSKTVDVLFTGVGVLLVSEIVAQGKHFQVEPLAKEERERTKLSMM